MNCHYFFENQINNDEFVFNFWPYPSEDMKIEYSDYPPRLTITELNILYNHNVPPPNGLTNPFDKTKGGKGFYVGGEKNENGFILIVTKIAYPLRFEITFWDNNFDLKCKTVPNITWDQLANARTEMKVGTTTMMSFPIGLSTKLDSYLITLRKEFINVRRLRFMGKFD